MSRLLLTLVVVCLVFGCEKSETEAWKAPVTIAKLETEARKARVSTAKLRVPPKSVTTYRRWEGC